jgi:hypothetical protein
MPELTITETLLIVACCLISILQIAIMYEISSIREELKRHYRTEADLDGAWELQESMFFDKFSRETHVIQPFQIPKDWNKIAGMDYGNTTCAYTITQDPKSKIFYVTNEWVMKNI